MRFSNSMRAILGLCFLAALFKTNSALAWGERGHHIICEVATKLVQAPVMKAFMLSRSESMGHVCNIPDIYWRSLGPDARIGDDAHFMNPENVGLNLQNVPDSIRDYYHNDTHPEDTDSAKRQHRMGSLYWRAQQFYDRAVNAGREVAASATPRWEEGQHDDLPFNKNTLSFLINLGLMGHFVGDASMPFHTNSDYDGWQVGHGGIHSFYEGRCVSWLDFGIEEEIYQRALEMRQANQLAILTPVAQPALTLTRAVAIANSGDRLKILAADHVKRPSTPPSGKGRGYHAQREAPEAACPAFRDLIVNEIATSSLALANLWDGAYADAGKPQVDNYHSFRYPFTPDFVGVDYLP